MGDDPPYLSVGTEVSAKYKGAFCEAKVRKVVKNIKCKVMFKLPGTGSAVVSDEQIKGLLRVGAQVEAKHPDKAQFLEAVINKIQDCSMYTVVFDDGDITTLRRTSLCLKSGRHFAESETLDQLPLTHPEHFGTPVLGSRRGGRRRDDSSDEDDDEASEMGGGSEKKCSSKKPEDREPDIGKIVCVEISEKKKGREPWFPGLIVAPTAQDAVSIRVKDEYLVRSFKDARYFTVPKKETTEFTREIAHKTEINSLKTAIEKALQYLDHDELPAHWDREVLFGLDDRSMNDSKGGSDGESSEEETCEEKDHFVAQLYKFMDDNGTPINRAPTVNCKDLDLYRLFKTVHRMGGFNRVSNQSAWKAATIKMELNSASNSASLVKQAYKKYLLGFEEFYRKLGCTMNSPRGPKSRPRPGRSLIRDKDRAPSGASTPKHEAEGEEEEKGKVAVEVVASLLESVAKNISQTEEDAPSSVLATEEAEPLLPPAEEEEADESSSSVSLPTRRQRERSLPLRLMDAKPLKKEEESGGDDNEHENESNSSQSVRSQRGTRSRIPPKDRTDEDAPEIARSARKRGRTKPDEDDEKVKGKIKDENVANGKEDGEKKLKGSAKEESEKKTKPPNREKGKGKKNEEATKTSVDEIRKAEDEDKSVTADGDEPTPKRRGRKPRAQADSEEEDCGRLPPHVDVQIGDKLKVYYGPMQDSKVTYEAKVCEIRVENSTRLYLVHYTGWNTRYDEWIKRVRIAENLTWTPNRKRSKSAHTTQLVRNSSAASNNTTGSYRGMSSKRGRARGQDSSRSATPSSVTSTSSTGQRNANNASGAEDTNNKNVASKENRRRSRRISEMSALSADSTSSDEEDEEDTSQSSNKAKKPTESEESEQVDVEETEQQQTPRRRHHRRRNSESERLSEPAGADSVQTPVRRGSRRRAATAPEAATPGDAIPLKEEPEAENKSSESVDLSVLAGDEQKRIETDLKKSKTELKVPTEAYSSTAGTFAKATSPAPTASSISIVPASSPPGHHVQDSVHFVQRGSRGSDDDIYEFREPEPFEFEVRARRESPFNEDRVHHQRFPQQQQAQQKAVKEEEEKKETSPKKTGTPTSSRAGSAERNKTVMTPPPTRTIRPCLTATALPISSPREEPESAKSAQSTAASLSPSPPQLIPIEHAQFSTIRSASPQTSVTEKEVPPVLFKSAAIVPSPSVSVITALPQIMPALSSLAARSVTVNSSRPSVVFAHKSPAAEGKSCPKPSEVALKAKKESSDSEEDDSDSDDDSEEEEVASTSVVDRTPVKRERRKPGSRKAISREFIESDEDSPEDRPLRDSTPKAKTQEKVSVDLPHKKTAENSQSSNNEQENCANGEKTNRVKSEEDLDENSLLCEETIPGSPVTHVSAPSADGPESSIIAMPSTSRSTVEMPFASAPSTSNLPRTRGLAGPGANAAARANRKRGLRQALAMQRPMQRSGAGTAVMENTPPTTPDGSLSSSSSSPQGEHGGLSPDHESSVKSEREFSETDNPASSNHGTQPSSSVVPTRNIGPRASATLPTVQPQLAPQQKRREDESSKEDDSPVKKRKRGCGNAGQDTSSASRRGRGYGRSPRRTGSDSEETAADYLSGVTIGSCTNLTNYQPRSTRYNFCTELDPELDASQRIASLQEKLRELRQTYSALKARIVVIDRRKKKLKRKDKEGTS